MDYSRSNFSEVANVFTALSSSPRVPEPIDARDKFVLVSWLDNATQANVFSLCQGSFKGFMSGLSAGGDPKSRNGGMAEWRKMTPNPKTWNGGK